MKHSSIKFEPLFFSIERKSIFERWKLQFLKQLRDAQAKNEVELHYCRSASGEDDGAVFVHR